MIKKLLKFVVLYTCMLFTYNMIWMNHPEYQQRPAEFPRYISNPSAYEWHPTNELAFYKSPVPSAEAKTETKRAIRKESSIETNRVFIDQMSRLENPDGNPDVINRYGYMGKFQMGSQAFREVGVKMTPSKWRRNPIPERTQDKLFLKFCLANSNYLDKDIKKYEGQRIKGIRIHKSNIIAAAHGGIGRVHTFLTSNGRIDSKDGNGTRISHYFRKFEDKHVDLSNVKINKKRE